MIPVSAFEPWTTVLVIAVVGVAVGVAIVRRVMSSTRTDAAAGEVAQSAAAYSEDEDAFQWVESATEITSETSSTPAPSGDDRTNRGTEETVHAVDEPEAGTETGARVGEKRREFSRLDESYVGSTPDRRYDLGRFALGVGLLCLVSIALFDASPAAQLTIVGIVLSGLGLVLVLSGWKVV